MDELIHKLLQKKYRKSIWTPFIHALQEFNLICEGDKIAVAISGGKDSLLLAKLLQELQKYSKVNFTLEFISINPGFTSNNLKNLEENIKKLNIPCKIYNDNIFEVAKKLNPNSKPCYMCARQRRGSLYTKATNLNCNKLALGHHLDDVIETTVMSMFYMGKIETMLAKLDADNFDIQLIRPLFYINEKDIRKFIEEIGINPMACGCDVAQGLFDSKRRETKKLLKELEKTDKDIRKRILQSTFNVNIEKIHAIKYKKDKFNVYELDKIIKK